jgi:hypothetical protein
MNATTTTPVSTPAGRLPSASVSTTAKRLPLVFIVNVCVAFLLLAALPIIHNAQKGFAPYAKLDKSYVNAAISSGEAEFIHKALKTTETARAMAHESHVDTIIVMQLAVVAFAILFAMNSFLLLRHHRQPAGLPRKG